MLMAGIPDCPRPESVKKIHSTTGFHLASYPSHKIISKCCKAVTIAADENVGWSQVTGSDFKPQKQGN